MKFPQFVDLYKASYLEHLPQIWGKVLPWQSFFFETVKLRRLNVWHAFTTGTSRNCDVEHWLDI